MDLTVILLIGVVALILLMFGIAGMVYFIHKKKREKESLTSLPSGADVSDFARDLQSKYTDD